MTKKSILFWAYTTLALCASLVFLVFVPHVSYKLIMWLPWSIVLAYTLLYQAVARQKQRLFLMIGLFAFCAASYMLLHSFGKSTVLIHNKYPPNLFYLSYGMGIIILLSFAAQLVKKYTMLSSVISFFSLYSYQIFFIHYVILIVLAFFIKQLHLTWYTYFLIVTGLSVLLQLGYLGGRKYWFKRS